jgi:hypothetical protein
MNFVAEDLGVIQEQRYPGTTGSGERVASGSGSASVSIESPECERSPASLADNPG